MIEVEASVLTTDAGRALLAEVAEVARAGPSDLARWRKSNPTEWVSAALRLVEGRRKGMAKFTRADRMWLDPVGVEQATAEVVARHKARRFAEGGDLVVDLCSGIGGDTLALAESSRVIAVDLDEGMGRRTLWNAGVYEVADRVLAVRSRAESFPIPPGARVHVDPDRRAGGRPRAKGLADYVPGLDFLRRLASNARGGALKLGPASDFEAHFGGPGFEVEVVSLGGECKEATAWFGDLASPEVRRRATVLPAGATWTDLDGPLGATHAAGPLDARAFDPDPALIRSGLLDGFASRHGLRRIAAGVDLLTGSARVESPFLAGFEVVEELPLDLKALRREVARRGLGPLEIKTRGLQTTPETYRAKLRPEGSNPATLILIAGRSGPSRAILARRV
jgi:THUMP domain-like/RNA cap guanine-N2 methyltransferase